jgi:hypothetical protein
MWFARYRKRAHCNYFCKNQAFSHCLRFLLFLWCNWIGPLWLASISSGGLILEQGSLTRWPENEEGRKRKMLRRRKHAYTWKQFSKCAQHPLTISHVRAARSYKLAWAVWFSSPWLVSKIVLLCCILHPPPQLYSKIIGVARTFLSTESHCIGAKGYYAIVQNGCQLLRRQILFWGTFIGAF